MEGNGTLTREQCDENNMVAFTDRHQLCMWVRALDKGVEVDTIQRDPRDTFIAFGQ
jgi:hypothetical protein